MQRYLGIVTLLFQMGCATAEAPMTYPSDHESLPKYAHSCGDVGVALYRVDDDRFLITYAVGGTLVAKGLTDFGSSKARMVSDAFPGGRPVHIEGTDQAARELRRRALEEAVRIAGGDSALASLSECKQHVEEQFANRSIILVR